MYRDDLAAAHARLEHLERELAAASSQGNQDRQRIAALSAQLTSTRDALARMGAQVQPYAPPAYPHYLYESRSQTVLVLGILSLVLCSVLGPIAWSIGNEELRRIDQGQAPMVGRGLATAGRVCGIVATALLLCGGFVFLAALAVGMQH